MRLMPLDESIGMMVDDLKRQVDSLIQISDWERRYPLAVEPPSALFCDAVRVSVVGYQEAEDPLNVKVLSEIFAHWTPHGLKVLDMIRSMGLNPIEFERTGAVYQTGYQNKKAKRIIEQADLLNTTYAYSLYTSAFYDPQDLVLLGTDYKDRAMMSIDMLDADPDLLLVGKPASTGTGWRDPWSSREDMAEHWSGLSPIMRREIPAYYDQLIAAFANWPFQGSEILLPYEFRGIRRGCRSDGEVEAWNDCSAGAVSGINKTGQDDSMEPSPTLGYQQVASKTRQVANDPSSVLFGHGTVGREWHQEMWHKHSSEYHVMPFEPGVIPRFLSTTPATMPGADYDDMVLVTADGSYQENSAYMANGRLVIPSTGRRFGADNFILGGIQLVTMHDHIIYMLASGCPYTMDQYLCTLGRPLGRVLAHIGCIPHEDAEILQVGDDLNIRIKLKFLPALLDIMGNYLSLKGMGVHNV